MNVVKFDYRGLPRNDSLKNKARTLRKAGNLAEVIFWQSFKDKKQLGFDIDRQYIIGNYIVDFFIPELGLVFEIDGSSHNSKVEYDAERDAYMNSLQLQIVRIKDLDVKKNIEEIYKFVLETIRERKMHLKFPS